MKKKIKIVIALVIVIAIILPFFKSRVKDGQVGETYNWGDYLEVTVNSLEFAEVIDGWGGANDNFWKPLTTDVQIYDRWAPEQYILEHGLKPTDSDDIFLCISYTAKNISKDNQTVKSIGTVDYDDGYEYLAGGLSFRKHEDAVWNENSSGLVLEKLKGDEYEFRAYIFIPKEVLETDKPLTYTLYGREYDLRAITK